METSLAQWFEPKKCVVLVVDMQNDYCSPKGFLASQGKDVTPIGEMVPRIDQFISKARKAGALIAFTLNTVLPDQLSDSEARRYFRQKTRPGLGAYPLRGSWGHDVSEDFNASADDLIIEKFRPSAFYNTSLNLLLRANDRSTVVVCGTATEGCVESTVRDAANYDYLPTIISDCIMSLKTDLHEASMKVMTHRFTALSSSDLIEHWSG